MKKILFVIYISFFFIPVSTTIAANKVVVIPLGSTVNIETPIEWKGQWLEGADYSEGDGLQYLGSSYISLENHTATTDNAPPNDSFWSLMALSGDKGDKGDTGATGPQGIQGNQGNRGEQGEVGGQGEQGIQGIQGPQGSMGPKGDNGDIGLTGATGSKGDKGDQGPQGDNAMELRNVVTVSASGANFTDPIAAMESIADASASNPYLVKIGPGIYDLGDNGLYMKEYVDIEGSGENVTVITSTNSKEGIYYDVDGRPYTIPSATILGASYCELRFLTVEHLGGSNRSVGIANIANDSHRITHVKIIALSEYSSLGDDTRNFTFSEYSSHEDYIRNFGSSEYSSLGVFNGYHTRNLAMTDVIIVASSESGYSKGISGDYYSYVTVTMTNVTIEVLSKENGGTGVFVGAGLVTMSNVTIDLSSVSGQNTGVLVGEASVTMTNVTIDVSSGGGSMGVFATEGARTTMTNAKITVTGESLVTGVHSGDEGNGMIMNNVTVKAMGGTTNRGVYTFQSATQILNSSISAEQYSIYPKAKVFVANTMLDPGVGIDDDFPNSLTCIGAYNKDFSPLNANCE